MNNSHFAAVFWYLAAIYILAPHNWQQYAPPARAKYRSVTSHTERHVFCICFLYTPRDKVLCWKTSSAGFEWEWHPCRWSWWQGGQIEADTGMIGRAALPQAYFVTTIIILLYGFIWEMTFSVGSELNQVTNTLWHVISECNEGVSLSLNSPYQSLAQFMRDLTDHLCQTQHHICQLNSLSFTIRFIVNVFGFGII